jgi:hypothetical protein
MKELLIEPEYKKGGNRADCDFSLEFMNDKSAQLCETELLA